jgi:hypothetical protein
MLLHNLRPHGLQAAAAAALLTLAGLAGACTSYSAPLAMPAARFKHAGRAGVFRDQLDVTVFQRGNLHTHSTESDGDHPPEAVYGWYRDHGYNFLALSDHNKYTDPNRYRAMVERPGFVLIPAEEVTMHGARRNVHINAICTRGRIGGANLPTVDEALRWGVARTREQGGIAIVNHPNFTWAFGAEALSAADGAGLLEIWSGYRASYPDGNANHPSVEAMWDAALTAGYDFAGVAVDDAHVLNEPIDGPKAGPGRAWVEVFANHANQAEICNALSRGWLVSSNGVRISRLTVRGDTFSVAAQAPGGTVDFIGDDGTLLSRQPVDPSAGNGYRLRGGEHYVRARVTAPSGARAWTQAYRIGY